MPGPRLARNPPTGVSSPASSSARPAPHPLAWTLPGLPGPRGCPGARRCRRTAARRSRPPRRDPRPRLRDDGSEGPPRPRCYLCLLELRARVAAAPEQCRPCRSSATPRRRPRGGSQGRLGRVSFEQRAGDAVERRAVLFEQVIASSYAPSVRRACSAVAQALGPPRAHSCPRASSARRRLRTFRTRTPSRGRRDLLEVVGCPVRDLAEDDLLGCAAGEPDLHPVDQLLARVQVAVLVGQVKRSRVRLRAPRWWPSARIAHEVCHHGVASLVVGEDAPLLLGDDAALLKTADDALERRLEIRLRDVVAVVTRGEDRCLVRDVGQVRAGQPGGLACDELKVDVGREGLAPRVNSQDLLAAGEIPRRDEDLPVEPAGPERAGSRSSSRFEAPPMTITWPPSLPLKPSSSTRSWFSVWSCSRLSPRPSASSGRRRARR